MATCLCVAASVSVALPSPGSAFQDCAELEPWSFKTVESGSTRAHRIQWTLARLYADGEEIPGSLTDGVLGPATTRELARLCSELELSGATADVADALVAQVDSIAVAMQAYPGWRRTLASQHFRLWVRGQAHGPLARYVEDRKPKEPVALLMIDTYVAGLTDGAFYLTEDDIKKLGDPGQTTSVGVVPPSSARAQAVGAPPEVVERVQALEAIRVPTFDSLDAFVDSIFAIGQRLAQDSIDGDPPPQEVDAALLPGGLPTQDEVESGGSAAAPAAGPGRGFLDISVDRPRFAERGDELDPDIVDALGQLQDRLFPDGDMFRTAVRHVAGIGPATPQELARVMSAARKSSPAERRARADTTTAVPVPDSLGLQPLAWSGGSCGCAPVVNGGEEPENFYGVYPFWAPVQRSEEPVGDVELDFSLMGRVGYYGLTFDSLGVIRDSLHWKMGRAGGLPLIGPNFSDFSRVTHNHKAKVDLIIYKRDWSAWLPASDSADDADAAGDRRRSAFERLTASVVDRIRPRHTNIIDRMKPIIALGQSPRRSLGDGVTLDFDMSAYSTEDQALLFDQLREAEFFRRLSAAIDTAQGESGRLFFDLDYDYSLNLVVPGYCVEFLGIKPGGGKGECGFFSMENLKTLETDTTVQIDLYLVDLDAQRPGGQNGRALTDRGRAIRDGLDRFESTIGGSEGATFVRRLADRMVPMLGEYDVEEIRSFVTYSEPVFSGAGSWTVPRGEEVTEVLTDVFTPPLQQLDLPAVVQGPLRRATALGRSFEEQTCNFLCPRRWWVRLSIFVVITAVMVLWLHREIVGGAEPFYRSKLFFQLSVASLALFVATLWCDPFWSRQQGLILLMFVTGAFALLLRNRAKLDQERRYP